MEPYKAIIVAPRLLPFFTAVAPLNKRKGLDRLLLDVFDGILQVVVGVVEVRVLFLFFSLLIVGGDLIDDSFFVEVGFFLHEPSGQDDSFEAASRRLALVLAKLLPERFHRSTRYFTRRRRFDFG